MPKRMKYRSKLTRFLAIPIFIVIAVTESRWETDHAEIAALLFFAGLVLIAIASLGRLWCALYISGYKTDSLVTDGPYSMSRNPLYLFSLLGAVGIGLTTEMLAFALIFAVAFAVYYPFVIRNEERRLLRIHAAEFEAYMATTPSFLPRLSLLREPEQYLANPIVFRRSLLEALWFIWLAGAIELLESTRELGFIPVLFTSY